MKGWSGRTYSMFADCMYACRNSTSCDLALKTFIMSAAGCLRTERRGVKAKFERAAIGWIRLIGAA
eukprot:3085683-Pleurochrysis_carterae.AAC.1